MIAVRDEKKYIVLDDGGSLKLLKVVKLRIPLPLHVLAHVDVRVPDVISVNILYFNISVGLLRVLGRRELFGGGSIAGGGERGQGRDVLRSAASVERHLAGAGGGVVRGGQPVEGVDGVGSSPLVSGHRHMALGLASRESGCKKSVAYKYSLNSQIRSNRTFLVNK